MKENEYQARLKKRIRKMLPDCIIIKIDDIQGFPDLLILNKYNWAALEIKRCASSHKQPNQEYWIDRLDGMSFASFIYPENEEAILDALQRALLS